jgi:MSHA biogenesis protein MshN
VSLLAEVLRERDARDVAHRLRGPAPVGGSSRARPLIRAALCALALALALPPARPRVDPPPVPAVSADAPAPRARLRAVEALAGGELRLAFDRVPVWTSEPSPAGAVELLLEQTEPPESLSGLDLRRLPLRSLRMRERRGDLRLMLEPIPQIAVDPVLLEGPTHDELRVRFEPIEPPAREPAAERAAAAPEPAREPPPPPSGEPLSPAERTYRAGLAALRAGSTEQAEGALRTALEHEPTHRPARLALARVWIEAKRYAEAQALLAQDVSGAPAGEELVLLRARLLVEQGQLERALALLEPAAGGGSAERLAFAAALLQRKGAHAEARELYTRALRSDPGQARYWLGLAISLEAGREPAAAIAAYRRALSLSGLELASRRFAGERMQALVAGRS